MCASFTGHKRNREGQPPIRENAFPPQVNMKERRKKKERKQILNQPRKGADVTKWYAQYRSKTTGWLRMVQDGPQVIACTG